MALRRWLTVRYLTVDPRALGAGRIALAVVLLLDLARRARGLETWYSNLGLIPNHTVLWRPPFEYQFSLFFAASRPWEAALGFVLCALAYSMLLVGVRTRLAQVLSLVAVLSLHGRCEFVQNGGDAALGELALWTCFLPTGRRYSIDALRAARGHAASSEPGAVPVVALAYLVLVLQLCVIYAFNALSKTGDTWRDGSVVHYMLYQACNDTWLAALMRDHFTLTHSKLLTWGAWATEGALPFLLLSPFAQRSARRAAVLLVIALHGGFALFLNLGIFVPAMLAFTPNLLGSADYDVLDRVLRRVRSRFRQLLAHPLVRAAREWLVARASVPPGERAGQPASYLARPALWDGVLGVIALSTATQILAENRELTRFKPEWQPRWMQATALYLQSFQGWSMYAPDPPLSDMNLHVDAVTGDGRHVDPFNEVASPANRHPGKSIPSRLGQDVLHFAYVLRLPWTPAYYSAFEEWILRYPKRTGRSLDDLVSFEVFLVEQDGPPPGEHTPRNQRSRLLFQYPR